MFNINTIFENPQLHRNKILSNKLISGNMDDFSGKSFICVSLTRFCPVGCSFCFFKSAPVFKKPSLEDHMTEKGVKKFIQFANQVNLGYLLVSGGGEPMIEKNSILQIVEEVDSERIVLVTSANWAKNYEGAKKYINSIIKSINNRKTKTLVTIRVSVDTEHCRTVTLSPIKNLIKLFYNNDLMRCIDLQIHSIENDESLNELIYALKHEYKQVKKNRVKKKRISDGKSVVKIVPKQDILMIDHLKVPIGYAKVFFSDLKIDLNDKLIVLRNTEVYQKDLIESEDGNSSIVTNKLGQPGLDFWVNYNGNVATWGNQYLDNLFNIYIDSAEDIILGTLSDPAALSFIEKGAAYRDKIVSEANISAIARSKSVNIRDYTGALIFDEARTRLYYTIRVLQDYIKEGRIILDHIKLSEELSFILGANKEVLVKAYHDSGCTIVEEVIKKGFNKDYVLDMLTWVKLGHYNIKSCKKIKLLEFYNLHSRSSIIYEDLDKVSGYNKKMQLVRMTEHLTHIKKEVLINEKCA